MRLRLSTELSASLATLRAHPQVRRFRALFRLRKRALLALALAAGVVMMVIHWS